MQEDLKKQIEAILFSAGRKMTAEEISRLASANSPKVVKKAVDELKENYKNMDSSIMIIEEGDGWKMTIREAYLPLVRNINPHTELSKTIMETLAVIAWKSPVLQSTVIKIRTNKAYDHITELEELGFVIREKYGRTFMLKLTQKFFEYFDLKDKKDITKIFKGIQALESEEQLQVNEFDSNAAAQVAEQLKGEEISKPDHEMEIVDEISEMEENETNGKKKPDSSKSDMSGQESSKETQKQDSAEDEPENKEESENIEEPKDEPQDDSCEDEPTAEQEKENTPEEKKDNTGSKE